MYVIYCFSLVAFNIFSLYLIFVTWITMCLSVFLLGLIVYKPLHSLDLGNVFFPMLRKFSAIISSDIFSSPFSPYSLSRTLLKLILMCLIVSQRSLQLSSLLFILFSLFWSVAVISTTLSSSTVINSSASLILLSTPSSVFFFFLAILQLWSLFFLTFC